MDNVQVLELQQQDKQEWDEFVYHSEQATVFHLAGWKDVMEDTFGLQCHYLLARNGDQVRGVLPLLHIKSKLSGHFLTSMPNALCAEDKGVAEALVERAKELVHAHRASYLILRDSHRKWDLPELVTNEDHCTLLVKLHRDPDQIWRGVNRRVRQAVQKAIRAELEVVKGADHLDSFYPVYSLAMRDMGTPTLGSSFFANVLRQFPEHFTVIAVRRNGCVLGGGFLASFRDTIYNTWGGMLRQSYELNPNYILYWDTLEYGCKEGFQWADLGRSAWDSGGFQFKTKWMAEPQPLYQQFYLNGTAHPPAVGSGMEEEARYRLFVNVWRRLPLAATEIFGPWLRKRMPFG